MKKITLKKIYVNEIESDDDMNILLLEENGINTSDLNTEIEIVNENNFNYSTESAPFKRKNLIKLLEAIDTEYVEIFYHTDHDNYIINGFNVEVMEHEDSMEELKKEKIALGIQIAAAKRRVKELQNKLYKLKENE